MSEFLDNLGDAVVVVVGGWTLFRLACGWRLEWHSPTHPEGDAAVALNTGERT